MAEQNFNQAVRIADRGYVIVHGKIAFEGGSVEELNNNVWSANSISDCERRYQDLSARRKSACPRCCAAAVCGS
jgi:ABC-type lipopolysaccharide export system ATPase subunit